MSGADFNSKVCVVLIGARNMLGKNGEHWPLVRVRDAVESASRGYDDGVRMEAALTMIDALCESVASHRQHDSFRWIDAAFRRALAARNATLPDVLGEDSPIAPAPKAQPRVAPSYRTGGDAEIEAALHDRAALIETGILGAPAPRRVAPLPPSYRTWP